MVTLLISASIFVFAGRLILLRGLWRLPLKNGEEFFLFQRVGAGFYQEAGAALLERYRLSLFLPLAIDAPLVVWLAATDRLVILALEQWLAVLATLMVYNVITYHFSARATAIVGDEQEQRPTSVQLSMSPRRLRDHTNWAVEALIWALMLPAPLLLVSMLLGLLSDKLDHAVRSGVPVLIWVSYLQVGLMLLKVVFVRWRMPLPASRTEDFRRWRSAWLTYHLKLLDSIRIMFALVLISGIAAKLYGDGWSPATLAVAIPFWISMIAVYLIYITRENRRLAAVGREINPLSLVKEFPRRPVPDGRFFAGGLLYIDRGNPAVIVRSPTGIAINLAHPSAYAWAGYFIGLVTLTMWIAA